MPTTFTGPAQATQHDGERREAEVSLCLAATGREEQEVDDPALRIVRIGQTGKVQQDEGDLEGPPLRRGFVGSQALS